VNNGDGDGTALTAGCFEIKVRIDKNEIYEYENSTIWTEPIFGEESDNVIYSWNMKSTNGQFYNLAICCLSVRAGFRGSRGTMAPGPPPVGAPPK